MARIMYISPVYYPTSSASITTHEVIRGLAQKGHYIDLLVSSRCLNGCLKGCSFDCDKIERINVHRISILTFPMIQKHWSIRFFLFTFSFLPLILYALIIARKNKFDLVIAMYHAIHLAPFSGFVISRLMNIPLMIKCHDVVSVEERSSLGAMFTNFLSRLNSIALKHAERILALSNELKFLIKELYKISNERFTILPNSVDTQMFRCNNNSFDVSEKFEAQDKKILLYVGSLKPPYRKRGLRFLIQAMPKVIANEPNVVLIVIGLVPDRVQKELETLATLSNVEKHVRFMKLVPYEHMPTYISIADICIGPLCPSLDTFGSTPRKVLEYMACAKPVIACYGGVARDLVINGYNGSLVHYGDLEELASSILKLVKNHKLARRIGLNGRSHAEAFYDRRVLADKLNNEILRM